MKGFSLFLYVGGIIVGISIIFLISIIQNENSYIERLNTLKGELLRKTTIRLEQSASFSVSAIELENLTKNVLKSQIFDISERDCKYQKEYVTKILTKDFFYENLIYLIAEKYFKFQNIEGASIDVNFLKKEARKFKSSIIGIKIYEDGTFTVKWKLNDKIKVRYQYKNKYYEVPLIPKGYYYVYIDIPIYKWVSEVCDFVNFLKLKDNVSFGVGYCTKYSHPGVFIYRGKFEPLEKFKNLNFVPKKILESDIIFESPGYWMNMESHFDEYSSCPNVEFVGFIKEEKPVPILKNQWKYLAKLLTLEYYLKDYDKDLNIDVEKVEITPTKIYVHSYGFFMDPIEFITSFLPGIGEVINLVYSLGKIAIDEISKHLGNYWVSSKLEKLEVFWPISYRSLEKLYCYYVKDVNFIISFKQCEKCSAIRFRVHKFTVKDDFLDANFEKIWEDYNKSPCVKVRVLSLIKEISNIFKDNCHEFLKTDLNIDENMIKKYQNCKFVNDKFDCNDNSIQAKLSVIKRILIEKNLEDEVITVACEQIKKDENIKLPSFEGSKFLEEYFETRRKLYKSFKNFEQKCVLKYYDHPDRVVFGQYEVNSRMRCSQYNPKIYLLIDASLCALFESTTIGQAIDIISFITKKESICYDPNKEFQRWKNIFSRLINNNERTS
jgi:hypothetical protein